MVSGHRQQDDEKGPTEPRAQGVGGACCATQAMNFDSTSAPSTVARSGLSDRPILLIPYVWIGDFVRCHSVVKLLRNQRPERPVDVLTSTLCAPLLDYMPGVRKG